MIVLAIELFVHETWTEISHFQGVAIDYRGIWGLIELYTSVFNTATD